jgi:hypothetical protein
MNARAIDNKIRPNEFYATTLEVNTSNENIQNSIEEGNLSIKVLGENETTL